MSSAEPKPKLSESLTPPVLLAAQPGRGELVGKGSWTTIPWGWGEREARHPAPIPASVCWVQTRDTSRHAQQRFSLCRETHREQKAVDEEQSLLQLSVREGFMDRNDCCMAQEEHRGFRGQGSLALLHRGPFWH